AIALVVVDSSNQSSWPRLVTRPRWASALEDGRPRMIAIVRSATIGARPSSAPARIAAAIAAGRPRNVSGTNSVSPMYAAYSAAARSLATSPVGPAWSSSPGRDGGSGGGWSYWQRGMGVPPLGGGGGGAP